MSVPINHESVKDPYTLQIVKLIDPNRLLNIFDEPDSPVAVVSFSLKLLINYSVAFRHTSSLVRLPSNTPLAKFELPILISELPQNSVIQLSVKGTNRHGAAPAASTVFDIYADESLVCDRKGFSSHTKQMRQGTYMLIMWPDRAPEVNTPSLVEKNPVLDQIYTLTNHLEQHQLGTMERILWLDKFSLPSVEQTIEDLCAEANLCLLQVELKRFPASVVYEENEYGNLLSEVKSSSITSSAVINDPEQLNGRINLAEELYYGLERNIDHKEIRPSQQIIDKLNKILSIPDYRDLEPEQKSLMWIYRYSLMDNNLALTKFLHAVNWGNPKEERIAVEMLQSWAPIEKEEILHLFSVSFCCNDKFHSLNTDGYAKVRQFAVSRIANCSDEELHSILLQLVQALRYEDVTDSGLERLLIERAMQSKEIAVSLHWFLVVESEFVSESKDWYTDILKSLLVNLERDNPELYNAIKLQRKLREDALKISSAVKKAKGDDQKKKLFLRKIVGTGGEFDMNQLTAPVPNPLNPSQSLLGVDSPDCTVFVSKMWPIKLSFRTDSAERTALMFKNGDDLRQDQLIIQMFRLMDSLLKQVNLDFKLKPYNVLATSLSDGFVEFVPNSLTISDCIESRSSLTENYTEEQKNTFIYSCAGYCVITYLLGIGDRHLENLLLDSDGHLFHIDFGFILGKDPKPLPPPMKLCSPMVQAMGGEQSPGYERFKVKCCEAFLVLRKHSRLIVNLFHLMIDSGLPIFATSPWKKTFDKLHDRFKMNLNDEQAERFMLELITESVNALMPRIAERLHGWATYWRRRA
jgi:phosphatidylinositol 3-kinase